MLTSLVYGLHLGHYLSVLFNGEEVEAFCCECFFLVFFGFFGFCFFAFIHGSFSNTIQLMLSILILSPLLIILHHS